MFSEPAAASKSAAPRHISRAGVYLVVLSTLVFVGRGGRQAQPPMTAMATSGAPEWPLEPALDGRLRVLTWNVWFGSEGEDERHVALIDELLRHADVVGLQEVTPVFAGLVRGHGGLGAVYATSDNEIAGYGILLLVRKALRPSFREVELPTRMGRSALVAALGEGRVGVATVHLESLANEATRRAQLAKLATVLKTRFQSAVAFGDFNFDDERTWGEWRRPELKRAVLENAVLAETLGPEYVDAWPAVHPTTRGLTFDGAVNSNVHDAQEQMRYDRVMVHDTLRPVAAALVGTAPITPGGLFPSDHYGVRVDVAYPRRAPRAQGNYVHES